MSAAKRRKRCPSTHTFTEPGGQTATVRCQKQTRHRVPEHQFNYIRWGGGMILPAVRSALGGDR